MYVQILIRQRKVQKKHDVFAEVVLAAKQFANLKKKSSPQVKS